MSVYVFGVLSFLSSGVLSNFITSNGLYWVYKRVYYVDETNEEKFKVEESTNIKVDV